MRYPSNMRISSAKNRYNKFDLSRDQITTSNFSQPLVSYFKEVVPGDNFNLKMESLIRLTPMVNPTFGRITLSHRFFFVPMRSIFRDWLSFINQTPVSHSGSTSTITTVPYCTMSDLANLFATTPPSGLELAVKQEFDPTVEDPDVTADFVLSVSNLSQTKYYNYFFTQIGKKVYNLFLNLGYNIDFTADGSSSQKLSLLPLLAYFKVFVNYYYPSAYDVNQFDYLFELGGFQVSLSTLREILGIIVNAVSYDPDYFVSAWDHPSSPNGSNSISPSVISDVNIVSGVSSEIRFNQSNSDGSPILNSNSPLPTNEPYPVNVTSYIMHMLDKAQDYLTRNQIAGYRPIDRFLSRFGIHLDYKESNRSLYLGGSTIPIQISEVTSLSDTFNSTSSTGSPLGYQGGKGVGYGQSSDIDFKSSEFGYIICISSITPHVGYYQGTNKELTHLAPLDFYTPEFDGAGVQAISFSELFSSVRSYEQKSDLTGVDLSFDSIFGFVPRFSEYKVGNDILSGDFRNAENRNSFVGYHLMREIADEFNYVTDGDFVETSQFYHSPSFVMQSDSSDYLRIFSNKSESADHFVLINHAEVHATRPMLSIIDGVEFYDKHHNDNKDIEVTNNGATFN